MCCLMITGAIDGKKKKQNVLHRINICIFDSNNELVLGEAPHYKSVEYSLNILPLRKHIKSIYKIDELFPLFIMIS